MAWYFNFCSPHLDDDQSVNLNRTLMVIELLLGMIITFIVHMLAELYDEQSSRVKNEADPLQNEPNDKKFEESAVSINKNSDKDDDLQKFRLTKGETFKKTTKTNQPGFFKNKKVFFLSVQTVQNKSPCFFGHFAIALAACAMYSPFILQSIGGFVYIGIMILVLIFQAWKYQRMLVICVGLSYLINIMLITSAVTGVGMSNWDPFQITCYYTKLEM